MPMKLPPDYWARLEREFDATIREAKAQEALAEYRKKYTQDPTHFMGMPVKVSASLPDDLMVFTDAESKPLGAIKIKDEKEPKK